MIEKGSITPFIKGRKYKRAVRLHNIVYVAMMREKGFLLWIHANHGAEVHHLEEAPKRISNFHNEVSQTSSTARMDDETCTRMRLLFQDYLVAIVNDKPLTAFWSSYLDITDMTFGLLLAAREEGWRLHFASICTMIT